jgi:glycoside/pentoside/hexuronide:cation symporter, GPH family
MSQRPGQTPEFTWIEGLAFCLAFVANQLCSELINQWGTYFYSPSGGVGRTIYVSMGLVGYVFVVGTLWDALSSPIVGIWSDRTKTKPGWWRFIPIQGRRRPFIFFGSIGMTFTMIVFWFPPVHGESIWNFVYGMVFLCLHWTMFTLTIMPLLALGPEVARSEEARVKLGTWIAVGMLAGLAIASALSGTLIELLDTAPPGAVTSPVGYRRIAVIYALVSLVLFQLPVWLVRERFDSGLSKEPGEPFLRCFADAARNKLFIIYAIATFVFYAGFQAAQRVLPYWAELGLGGSERTVTWLLLPFLLTALLSYAFIPMLTRRFSMKWMFIAAFAIIATGMPWMFVLGKLPLSNNLKMFLGGALFAYCGLGQGIMYVMQTPFIGAIIDYDAARTGHRREAFYNSLYSLAVKASMAGSVFMSTQTMHLFGSTKENPLGILLVGPFAGLLAFIGLTAMLFYPNAPEKT